MISTKVEIQNNLESLSLGLGNYDKDNKQLKDILSSVLSKESGNYTRNFLELLNNEIKMFLLEINNIMYMFNNEINKSLMHDQNLTEAFRRYIVAKDMIKNQPKIEQILKQGYYIIDQIREAFTGEELLYQVGVTYYGKMYEGRIPLSQILKMSKVEPIWKNSANNIFKLRLSNMKKNELSNILKENKPESPNNSTLWSSISAYASAQKKKNFGNLYEAYRVLYYQRGSNKIPPPFSEAEFEQVLKTVRSNTTSFAKGGDLLNESIKFFGNSAPSLASLSTIKIILEAFSIAISLTNIDQIKTSLAFLFEKEPIINQTTLDFNTFEEEEFKKLINYLKNI